MADTKMVVRGASAPAKTAAKTGVAKAKYEQALQLARRARVALANVKEQSAEIGKRLLNGACVVGGGVHVGVMDGLGNDGKGFAPGGIPLPYLVGSAETAAGLLGTMVSKNPFLEPLYYLGTGALAYASGNSVRGILAYQKAVRADNKAKA